MLNPFQPSPYTIVQLLIIFDHRRRRNIH